MSLNMNIANKYTIIKRIGQGAFGSVFKAECLKTKKTFAAKLEKVDTPFSLIKHEAAILHYLNSQTCSQVPHIYYYGVQSCSMAGPYYCLVMTYYEGSLEDLGSSLTLQEKMEWWNIMINTLKQVHKAGIVHRDLKPAHFMRNSHHGWNLIDFGLATSFMRDAQTHIDEEQKEHIIGSPNYVSYHVHQGKDVVARDDFISLIYILWELLYGSICCSNTIVSVETGYKREHILHPYNKWLKDQKEWTRLYHFLQRQEDICCEMIVGMLTHGQFLKFKDKPNYDHFVFEFSGN